ncbi:M48 family metalloprotease [Desulfonatronospira sp.]|uniref:M48 family metalloprotease n=1 Tax=Desulfonatronospira sp. TaxID=1962951 RepID=UPI0025C72E27|nr:M48 family metalloprotease [Desulfonatronospira sp.]
MPSLYRLKVFTCLLLMLALCVPASQVNSFIFGEFTISDEAELGQKVHRLIRSNFEVVQDPVITGYVQEIASRLEKAAPPQPFPLQVDVVEDRSLNAMATVAGYMVLFSGMITRMETESELAYIMSHELAHITQRHVARNIERSKKISAGALLGIIAGALVGADAGQTLAVGSIAGAQSAFLSYSREDEREADHIGMNYLIQAGYNPEGAVSALQKIRRLQFFAGGDIPSYMSTHPGVDERINYLRNRIERLDDHLLERQDDNRKLYRVQTLLRARHDDPAAALDHFRKETGDECLANLGQGIANSRMNRVRDAQQNFEKLLSCDDSDPLFLREAGRFYFQYDQLAKAGELLQKAVMLNPEDSLALLFYARVLAEKGDRDTAINYFHEALKKMPENPRVHEYLARTYGGGGDNFMAHLHMAYAHIFSNQRSRADFHLARAREAAQSPEQEQKLKELKNAYEERLKYWKKS